MQQKMLAVIGPHCSRSSGPGQNKTMHWEAETWMAARTSIAEESGTRIENGERSLKRPSDALHVLYASRRGLHST
jgi:hypothetical protein